ncbi:MAG TPA: inositol monophosphatase family protein [Aeromicrobium sp.]|nr:inositol monophosphatase family protein [Aeromicrobium sp.]
MTTDDALYELARRTAEEAAELIRSERPQTGRVEVVATKSSRTDVVTDLDRRTEQLIRSRILAVRPHDGFVGEEGAGVSGSSGVEWVVDPIDGTVNFVYGIEAYAVSIGVRVDGVVVAGYVADVPRRRAWGAIRGRGAWRHHDEERIAIRAPRPHSLSHALVATGFSYVPEVRAAQAAAVAKLLPHVRDIRRIGSAAIDLCTLAEGGFDAYVEQGLHPWDVAAGGLVAEESGLVLQGLSGPPDTRLVMAAHPEIAEEYFALVRACGF